MKLAALGLHVSRIVFKCQLFSQDADEAGTGCDETNYFVQVSHVRLAQGSCSPLSIQGVWCSLGAVSAALLRGISSPSSLFMMGLFLGACVWAALG